MPNVIKSGDSGNTAKVTSDGLLQTYATTRGSFTQVNLDGDAYNINTGFITLTNAADTPVLYLKNNETRDFLVTAIAVGVKDSTGGTDLVAITIVRNPTAGTIVSNASAVAINSNRNFGSNKALTADAYKGATGSTMTDGTDHILVVQPDSGRLFATVDEVLPKGTSIGIKIAPPANNTSMIVYAAIIGHLVEAF